MSTSRQDRVYPRTAAQLELAYNFGKSFAEIMGVADDARHSAEKTKEIVSETKEIVSEWSKTLETEFSGIRAELSMKIDKDENDNLIGKIHIGADQLTIDTDNFKLSAAGEITATAGYIGDWEIINGALYAETNYGYKKETIIAPGIAYFKTHIDSGHRSVKIADGCLSIELTDERVVIPTFATFTFSGKRYSLCIDFNDNNRLYAYERSD